MKRIPLSKNFYLHEFTRSQTAARYGIDMSVAEGGIIYSNLRNLCLNVLQPLRNHFGAVHITSGYRPPKLNRRIGGSRNSQHLYGLAADIVVPGVSPLEVAKWIKANCKGYDQVIHEFGEWVHVSVASRNRKPRNQRLTAIKVPRRFRKPKTVYVPGLFTLDEAIKRAT